MAGKRNRTHTDACPTCGRNFRSIRDYPRVHVIGFEALPVPEAMDSMSDEAAQSGLRRRREIGDLSSWDQGINRTPEIANAMQCPEVVEYLKLLAFKADQGLDPHKLLPDWSPSGYFRWAYPIPGTKLFLSLDEADESPTDRRTAEVQIHCQGPNLGSAGGATLQPLGAIARIHYRGILLRGEK